jgi:hypothetical protein
MCQADKFIATAVGEIGYIEGPADNETKYQKANQPWCGAFVNWCAKQVGLKIPDCTYTPAGAKAFAEAKRWQDVATAESKPMALSSSLKATPHLMSKAINAMVVRYVVRFALTKLKIGGKSFHLCRCS